METKERRREKERDRYPTNPRGHPVLVTSGKVARVITTLAVDVAALLSALLKKKKERKRTSLRLSSSRGRRLEVPSILVRASFRWKQKFPSTHLSNVTHSRNERRFPPPQRGGSYGARKRANKGEGREGEGEGEVEWYLSAGGVRATPSSRFVSAGCR